MQEAILSYFTGEKNAGVVLIILAIIGMAMAWIFFQPKYNLRAFAITLAVFSLIEIAIGSGLFLRTDKQVRGLLSELNSNPQIYFSGEKRRMTKVQNNFVNIQYTEAVIMVIGVIVALTLKNRPAISGVALAFVIHAAILLAFDIIAERRGAEYLATIHTQP